MIIRNAKLIREMRKHGRCEICRKMCKKREGHHVIAKGMGGGRRLDIRCNLLSLGSTREFECRCHAFVDTAAGFQRCLEIVAAKEKCSAEEVESVLRFILRLDKHASKYAIEEALVKLPSPAREIARRELEEANKIEPS